MVDVKNCRKHQYESPPWQHISELTIYPGVIVFLVLQVPLVPLCLFPLSVCMKAWVALTSPAILKVESTAVHLKTKQSRGAHPILNLQSNPNTRVSDVFP